MVDLDRIIGNYINGLAPIIQLNDGRYIIFTGGITPYASEDSTQGLHLGYYYHIPGTYSYEYDSNTGQWLLSAK